MKETAIMNCVSVMAGAFAIAVACKTTKTAWPLFAFAIIPTFSATQTTKGDEETK